MKRFFLFITFLTFQLGICVYAQGITPFKLEHRGTASTFGYVVDKLNQKGREYVDKALDYLSSAVEAIENERYSYAVSLLENSLYYFNESGRKSEFKEQIKKIEGLSEFCKKKIKEKSEENE